MTPDENVPEFEQAAPEVQAAHLDDADAARAAAAASALAFLDQGQSRSGQKAVAIAVKAANNGAAVDTSALAPGSGSAGLGGADRVRRLSQRRSSAGLGHESVQEMVTATRQSQTEAS